MNNGPRKIFPSFLFRMKARNAMKHAFQTLLLLTLLAMLPSLITQTAATMLGIDPMAALMEMAENPAAYTQGDAAEPTAAPDADAALTPEEAALTQSLNEAMALSNSMMSYMSGPGMLYLGLSVITLLIAPILMQPLLRGVLQALRGREVTAVDALSRLKLAPKALGTSLLVLGKTLLAILPGYGVMIVGSVVMLMVNQAVGTILFLGGCAWAVVRGLKASYGMMLSDIVLCDQPERGVKGSVRRSIEIMEGRRMELFMLQISFVGWSLLITVIQSLLISMVGSVIALTAAMALNLVLQTYIHMAVGAFYEVYANGVDPVTRHQDMNAQPPADDLN